jgi:hypothetical protein
MQKYNQYSRKAVGKFEKKLTGKTSFAGDR